ncbi:DDHD2 [Symbiodinium pilosum]|uniref:DDHD2 protein n=1 Tax=Symbiodinium pilosum TaxID=2952 RepID=A0A812WBX7_SYMPI|nr:DDHD2 [Symbiodinium pilosum]
MAAVDAFWLALALAGPGNAVLRYPDGAFESRYPLHIDECALPGQKLRPESVSCLGRLRQHLLEDGDCNRVICDNIASSTPVEVYANETDWAPFKNLCGHLQELFLGVFDLGVKLVEIGMTEQDTKELSRLSKVFATSPGVSPPDLHETPEYANTTRAVLRRHASAVLDILSQVQTSSDVTADELLEAAAALARRLQLLIENVSATLLLNFHLAQLDHNGRVVGRDLIQELYGDVNSIQVVFHEIPGKRWDALTNLLDKLGVSEQAVSMAEIGVEAANTSQRLLERNPHLSYLGVDPYVNNEALFLDVNQRLSLFRESGRFVLMRNTSLNASLRVADGSLDMIFLDARHDFQAVIDDIAAWKPKLRAGGILSGHDFSWMFPTVAMAVYKETLASPERTVHLAPDGVWWLQL